MKSKKMKWLIIIGIVILLAVIVQLLQNAGIIEKKESGTPVNTAADAKKPTRTEAYIIAKQFAQSHLGDVNFGFGDDGFTDYQNGDYHITGVADLPGKRIRWTIELHYNGGDIYAKNNWIEKGWFSQ